MTDERFDEGMAVRREVLGDDHVDRAMAETTPFTEPFQEFITRTAWGDVWARPGLDRRTRSCITLAVLTALRVGGRARDARPRGASARRDARGDRRRCSSTPPSTRASRRRTSRSRSRNRSWPRRARAGPERRPAQPHTSRATWPAARASPRWSSTVTRFPGSVEANPHCGLSARRSSGMWARRLLDPSLQLVRVLQLGLLRGDQPEHDGLVLGHEAQRLEGAGARRVVLGEDPVDREVVEQLLGDRVVAALDRPHAAVVPAAQVHRERGVRERLDQRVVVRRSSRASHVSVSMPDLAAGSRAPPR